MAKNGVDALVNQNRGRSAPRVLTEDLGGGKHMPQSGKLIPIAKLLASPWQPRKAMDENELQALAESIKADGLDTPIIVRPVQIGEDLFFEIIEGHRRVRAVSSKLGWDEIPANVKELTNAEAAIKAFTANVVRVGFSDFEKGTSLKRLLDERHVRSVTDLEKLTGFGRGDIYRFMKLASLPDAIVSILNDLPNLIGGTAGEHLAKFVEAGDEDLALKAVERVRDGVMKESHILQWYQQAKKPGSSTPTVRRVAIRQDSDLLATLKPNAKGGFDISVVPKAAVNTEKLQAELTKFLQNLKISH